MEDNKPATTGTVARQAKKHRRPPKTRSQNPQDAPERLLEISIGLRLRTLRLERGRTITDLSRACGLSISMLSKIENGMISPSLSSLQRLGTALSVPLSTFFSGFGDEGPSPVPAGDPTGDPPAAPPDTGD